MRGVGLILGMELMQDGAKRIPFDPALKVGEESQRMVYVKSGQPFRIVGVDGQGDGVTAQPRGDAAPTQVLTKGPDSVSCVIEPGWVSVKMPS